MISITFYNRLSSVIELYFELHALGRISFFLLWYTIFHAHLFLYSIQFHFPAFLSFCKTSYYQDSLFFFLLAVALAQKVLAHQLFFHKNNIVLINGLWGKWGLILNSTETNPLSFWFVILRTHSYLGQKMGLLGKSVYKLGSKSHLIIKAELDYSVH